MAACMGLPSSKQACYEHARNKRLSETFSMLRLMRCPLTPFSIALLNHFIFKLPLCGVIRIWLPSMIGNKLGTFGTDYKWSSLNTPSTENPVSNIIFGECPSELAL